MLPPQELEPVESIIIHAELEIPSSFKRWTSGVCLKRWRACTHLSAVQCKGCNFALTLHSSPLRSGCHHIRRRFIAVLHISVPEHNSRTDNWALIPLGTVTTGAVTTGRHYHWAPLQLGAVTTGLCYNWTLLQLNTVATGRYYD